MKKLFVVFDGVALGCFADCGREITVQLAVFVKRVSVFSLGCKKFKPLIVNTGDQTLLQWVVLKHAKTRAVQAVTKLRWGSGAGKVNNRKLHGEAPKIQR